MFSEVLFAKKDSKSTTGGDRVSPERKVWVREESAKIFAKNLITRDETKETMFVKRIEREKLIQENREERLNRWQKKTKSSPYAIDLVAEDERIYEEHLIRSKEEEMRNTHIRNSKSSAQNDIILKALSEFSDLEALRKEKKALQEEEQRLRALLALEKTNVNGKADRLIAQNALRQRHEARLEHRRKEYKKSLEDITSEERNALSRKHGIDHSGKPDFRI